MWVWTPGPIVSQCRTAIQPEDDSATLHDRLAQLGAELLVQTIPDYVAGKIQPRPQPADGASHAAKIKKEDGRIDWNQPARDDLEPAARLHAVARRVHVFEARNANRPRLRRLKIWKAEIVEQSCGGACRDAASKRRPGEILSADKTGIIVGCGEKALRILELQLEGGRRMSAAEFLAGHALKIGEKFER